MSYLSRSPATVEVFLFGIGTGVLGSYLLYRAVTLYPFRQTCLLRRLWPSRSSAFHERDEIEQQIGLGFGDPKDYFPLEPRPTAATAFASRCSVLCEKYTTCLQDFTGEGDESTCAEIGCSIGDITFELSKCFTHVLGIDPSKERIAVAEKLKDEKRAEYTLTIEGSLTKTYEAMVDPNAEFDGVRLMVQDPSSLPENLAEVDCVLAARLLTRLYQPENFLRSLPRLIKPNGTAVLVTDYDWDMAITPKRYQLHGGFSAHSKDRCLKNDVKRIMTELGFNLLHEENIPFVKRVTARKYLWKIAHATVWRKGSKSTT